MRFSIVSPVIAAAALSAGCSSSPSAAVAPTTTASASVTISGQTTALAPNMKVQLSATLKGADGSTSDCTAVATWSSSNDKLLKLAGTKPGEFLVVDAGDSSASAVCSNTTGTLAIHVDKPTSWPVTGRILAGPDGAPVSGATVTFGDRAPVTTSDTGEYTIVTPDSSLQRLLISAPGFQTRDTWMRGGTLRTQDIDLLSGDLLALFRAMARNGHESPQSVSVAPTRRWTQNPNIYIWTTWKDTDGPVNNVDFYVREIRRIIPQLTGGRFEAGLIEFGPLERPLTSGWINLVFDHAGNNAILGGNPGRVQLGGDHTCNQIAITHEFGHAMGYWHSGRFNTIMGTTPGYCHEADFTPDELRVAKAMYARANGNREPDRDPDSSSPLALRREPPVVAQCDHIVR